MSETEKSPEPGEIADSEQPEPITFAEFLETPPPGQLTKVVVLYSRKVGQREIYYELIVPEIQLHCTSDTCNGPRFFRYKEGSLRLIAAHRSKPLPSPFIATTVNTAGKF